MAMQEESAPTSVWERVWRAVFGAPRDLGDRSLFHRLALVPLLAWVGLGADGLSSSAYGPAEAFHALLNDKVGDHRYLLVALAAMTIITVFIISAGYNKIIEHFPQGAGGYVVANTLLGTRAGVISGCALLIDYLLTVTVSIAAASDALFSFLPKEWHSARLFFAFGAIALLVILNIRGLHESVTVLAPIFVTFCVTHLIVIIGGIVGHFGEIGSTVAEVGSGFSRGYSTLGIGGMLLLFMHAYSLGGGTYTGIEAVSNGLNILREPRVENGKRTMVLMACSLALTASGLLLLYLLWHVQHVEGETLNATLVNKMTAGIPGGGLFSLITILSEGALLVVAAQAGFVAGPRVLAQMATDSWMPRRFAALSERLTAHNGIALIGVAAIAALLYTGGNVSALIVLYSINVFITFSLSMLGMLIWNSRRPKKTKGRTYELWLFTIGFLLCATILAVTTFEKFFQGGWLTLLVTGGLATLCFVIKNHYKAVAATLNELYAQLEKLPPLPSKPLPPIEPMQPTAVLLVGNYGGLGIHTFGNIFRHFGMMYKQVVFVSVGAVDSGEFKGENSIEQLRERVQKSLDDYVELSKRFGVPSTSRMAIGTEVVAELEALCLKVKEEFPRATFFAGKVIFQRETWYQNVLHNETALAVQKRLQWAGHVMVILPARIR